MGFGGNRAFGVILVLLAAGCAGPGDEEAPANPTDGAPPAALVFSATVYPDPEISGSEPALEVAPDGTIYVSKHLGQRASRVWKSANGTTFEEVSPRPVMGEDRQAGFSGDGELATDAANNVYYSDLYLASASVYASRDAGKTWSANYAASPNPVIDRQWIDAFGDGKLYLSGDQLPAGAVTAYSEDHGRTFTPATPIAASGKLLFESRPVLDKATGRLFVPLKEVSGAEQVLAFTSDHGRTWTLRNFRTPPSDDNQVAQPGPLARDEAGTIYWTSLENNAGNYQPRVYVSKDEGQTWSPGWTVPSESGSKVFLWTRAREVGHLAVGWFGTGVSGTPDTANGEWNLYVADVHGADEAEPVVTISKVNQRPVKNAPVCTGGATCSGNRELGDFFEMEFGPDGRLHLAWAETKPGGTATTVAYAQQV